MALSARAILIAGVLLCTPCVAPPALAQQGGNGGITGFTILGIPTSGQIPVAQSATVARWTTPSFSATLVIGTTAITGGTNGDCLYDNAGVLGNQVCGSTIVVGTTVITGGTPSYLVYDNSGVVGENTVASFLTSGTGVTITGTTNATVSLAAIAADNLLGNFTGGSAAPIAGALTSCSTGSSALTYNTSTHAFGCNTISGSGTVNSGTAGQMAYYASSTTAVSGNVNATISAGALTLGVANTTIGKLLLEGNTSGALTITPQATAGTPTWTAGTSSGTPAVTASAPLGITTATGNITCATCATTTSGGAISGTAPVAVSSAGAISITGAAGQVLAGTSPAFTATPTLGASGTLGSITFGNATSGTVTLQTVTGALSTPTLSLPAATDTLIGKATTDTLTNKTYDTAGTGNSLLINGVAVTANSGTGSVVRTTSPSISGLTVTGSLTATGLVTNVDLVNSSLTIAGHLVSLGGTQTLACADLSNGTTNCSAAVGQLPGTTTNDNASTGNVGEFVTSLSSNLALTNGTPRNLTSISLTAGDWVIYGTMVFNPAGTTTGSALIGVISLTTASTTPIDTGCSTVFQAAFSAGAQQILPSGMCRLSIASTTTVFYNMQANFTISTASGQGEISARRAR